MKIVFFGTPEFVVPVLEELKNQHDVVGIVTTPDAKAGRKHLLTPTPVKKYAQEHTIPVFSPKLLDKKVTEKLQDLRPDFLVVAAYGQIIPQEVLDISKVAAINIHPSLLPKYRGPSPIQETILQGDTETGVTLIQMDAEIDHGPILAQAKTALTDKETFLSLADKLFRSGSQLLLQVMQEPLKPKVQNHEHATFTDHITKEDGFIDITNPPSKEQTSRRIRAYYPWPGVFFRAAENGQTTKIIKLLPNGKIQMEGKNPVSVKDFLNGYPELRETMEKLI